MNSMAIGAKYLGVFHGVLPTMSPLNLVVGVAARLGPPASLASIAVFPDRGIRPSLLGEVDLIVGFSLVGRAFVP